MGAETYSIAGLADDGINIYSNRLRNRQAVREAEFSAARSRLDAAYNRFAARETRASGEADARIRGLKTTAEVGRVRAGSGASGVDANVGTPTALAADARTLGDYDAALIRHGAAVKAWGHEYDAHNASLAANLADARARTLRTTGILDVVSGGLRLGGGLF